MANLEHLVNLGKGYIGVGLIILPTSRFQFFQNKNWGKILGEKKEKKGKLKERFEFGMIALQALQVVLPDDVQSYGRKLPEVFFKPLHVDLMSKC